MIAPLSYAVEVIGPSGSGKSYLAASALRYYGSGVVLMAPGDDERNSYFPLFEDGDNFDFQGFDDVDFQLILKSRNAHALADATTWLTNVYTRLRAEYDKLGRVESRKVLVVDAGTALGQFAMNATLQKFNYDEPPPVRGEKGYPFFTYLMTLQNGIFSKMRAIRGLGLHWIVTGQAAERDVTPGQAAPNEGMLKSQVMAAYPGGFRDKVPQFFDLVFQAQAIAVSGKPPEHKLLWVPDPKRSTKSRFGSLGDKPLPNVWTAILPKLTEAQAATRLLKTGAGNPTSPVK